MVTIAKVKQDHKVSLEARIPYESRALKLLESTELRERMKGYALLTTCFHLCSPEIRNYTKSKWNGEKNLQPLDKDFLNHCKKIFGVGK